MTSLPLASAEHSSGTLATANEAAGAPSQLQTREHGESSYLFPVVSSAADTPRTSSSIPSLGSHSPLYSATSASPALSNFSFLGLSSRGPRHPEATHASSQESSNEQQTPHRSPKRRLRSSEFTALSNFHSEQGGLKRSAVPKSVGHRPVQARKSPQVSENRLPGRPPRNPLFPGTSPLSPRRDGDGKPTLWPPFAPTRTPAQSLPSPTPHDPSGASSSTGSQSNAQDHMALDAHQPAGALASPSKPRSAGLHITHHQANFSGPAFAHFPRSSFDGTSVSSNNQPIPSAVSSSKYPSRTLPLPSTVGLAQPQPHPSLPGQFPPQISSSAAVDGYKIIRNAVPMAGVRSLAAMVAKRLPVNAQTDTHEAYVMPVQAYMLRDEFNSVSLLCNMSTCSLLTV